MQQGSVVSRLCVMMQPMKCAQGSGVIVRMAMKERLIVGHATPDPVWARRYMGRRAATQDVAHVQDKIQ